MIIATAGHVDHGKTTLVKALTGVDTDSLAEEKARGLTINLGFAYTDAETGGRIGFVDVPGHIKFISNMLAGVAAIDHALLVVAADDGIMPQTIEHLEILDLLGISEATVALTKIDRCEADRIATVSAEIKALLSTTHLAGAEIYPVAATTGEGIDMLRLALDLAADESSRRSATGEFRLSIDRRFNVKGSGIVVTGSVFAGAVSTTEELILMPQGLNVRVRGIHTQNQISNEAMAGDRAAINIAANQLTLESIHRGNWLTSNRGPAIIRADARLKVLSSEKNRLNHWTPVHFHSAANHVTGRIATLEANHITPGDEGLVQLQLASPVNLCVGDRFVLRDQAALRTLGGGVIIALDSPARGRAKPDRIAALNRVNPSSPQASLLQRINHSPMGFSRNSFRYAHNLTESGMADAVAALAEETPFQVIDETLISDASLNEISDSLTMQFDTWHKANPTQSGLPINQVQRLFARNLPDAVLRYIVQQLIADKTLAQDGNRIKRPGFSASLPAKESKLWTAIEPILVNAGTRPPVVHDLAAELKISPADLKKSLDIITKAGLLVRPVNNRYFLPATIALLKEAMTSAAGEGDGFTVQQYRDTTGLGRNLSIEILEFFDYQGLTKRIGDQRKIMESPQRSVVESPQRKL